MRYLTSFIILGLLAVFSLSGCSSASRSFNKGETLESDGKFEEAMYSYADAFMKDPEAGTYRIRFFNMREKAAKQRFTQGNQLLAQKEYAAALEEFRASYALDPTQERLKQQVDLAERLKDGQLAYVEGMELEKGNKFKAASRAYAVAVELHPENKEYQAAQARVSGMRISKLAGEELSLKSNKPITLKFKDAKLKDVFNIITQLSGINFIFDEGIKDQPVTIYLENATFQQAMDLLTNMFKLGRKVANESTVIIYPKTPDKSKQYEDMQVRTFHLNFMDAKKAVNLIRTMIQVRKVFVNEDSNSIIVRDTNDIVDVVEKILEANDVPDPEVVLDVEVVEISDTKAQNVGLLLSNYNVQLGAFTPEGNLLANSLTAATTTTGTPATTSAQVSNLLRAFTLKGYGGFVTVPSAQYNLGKNLTNGEVLSNPKIRIKNKEKAKFNVGTRVPITTTTLNNTLSQVNVQYVDVGVKVNAEPTIQLNNEIVIKLSLEVSSIISKESVGGSESATTVVTIGTRNLDTVLSLKDGETSIIGGLIQNTKSESKQKIFLLGDLPLIGPLISNNVSSKDKTELLLAITPRLVRGVTVPRKNLMSFSSGNEDYPSLVKSLASFEQEPEFEVQPAALPQPATVQSRPVRPTQVPTPGLVPAPSAEPVNPLAPPPAPGMESGANSENQPAQNGSTKQATAAPAPAPAPPQRILLQIGTPGAVSVGQQFSLEIKVSDVANLIAAPFVMTYDPIFTEFVSASEAGFLKQDGKPTTFSTKADPANGTVTVSMARAAGSGGVSGSGTLAFLIFRATNQGPANFGFRSVAFSAADGQPLTVLPFSTAIELK